MKNSKNSLMFLLIVGLLSLTSVEAAPKRKAPRAGQQAFKRQRRGAEVAAVQAVAAPEVEAVGAPIVVRAQQDLAENINPVQVQAPVVEVLVIDADAQQEPGINPNGEAPVAEIQGVELEHIGTSVASAPAVQPSLLRRMMYAGGNLAGVVGASTVGTAALAQMFEAYGIVAMSPEVLAVVNLSTIASVYAGGYLVRLGVRYSAATGAPVANNPVVVMPEQQNNAAAEHANDAMDVVAQEVNAANNNVGNNGDINNGDMDVVDDAASDVTVGLDELPGSE